MIALSIAAPLSAQGLSGAWEMATTATMPSGETAGPDGEKGVPATEPCVFSGGCQMTQDGTSLTGTVELMLVSGAPDCPAEMTAALQGTVDGDDVVGVLSGPAGDATFEGSRGNSLLGSFLATGGPFAGTAGDWVATRPASFAFEIPAAGPAGLAALVLTLIGAGLWLVRRRQA